MRNIIQARSALEGDDDEYAGFESFFCSAKVKKI